jgi:hypothetical protein
MKNIKKILVLLTAFTAVAASAMEQNYTIEQYNPERDKPEVEQILKNNWSSQVWGEQGKQFDQKLADALLDVSVPNKSIDLARSTLASKGSDILGFITYISFDGDPASGDPALKARRGYIELLSSKDLTSTPQRVALEQALRRQAIEKMKTKNPEKIEEFVMKDDNFSIELLKKLGFEQVKEGQFARKFELPIKN